MTDDNTMQAACTALLHTRVGDDIDIALCLLDQSMDAMSQMADEIAELRGEPRESVDADFARPSTQVPSTKSHRKWWPEFDCRTLAEALRSKYANAARLQIPAEYDTEW